eukprot:5309757-Pleurochrysis_carterae.AAC.2
MEAAPLPPLPMADVADCPARIDANGYLKEDNLVSSYALSWVQPSISSPDRPDDALVQYSQVIITTETARLSGAVGEFVYISPGEDGPVEIGKIISLFDAGPDEENAMMFEVQWLFRKEHMKGAFARSMHNRELLLSTSEPDKNYIDAIEWKVSVLLHVDAESAGAQLELPHTFFCNRMYDPAAKKIVPLPPSPPSAPPTPVQPSVDVPLSATVPVRAPVPKASDPAPTPASSAAASEHECSAASTDTISSAVPATAPVMATPATPSLAAAPSVSNPDAAPVGAEPKTKRRVTVLYSDFLSLKEEVQSLRSLVATHNDKLENRLTLLESKVVCPSSSASSAGSVPSSQSLPSTSS